MPIFVMHSIVNAIKYQSYKLYHVPTRALQCVHSVCHIDGVCAEILALGTLCQMGECRMALLMVSSLRDHKHRAS